MNTKTNKDMKEESEEVTNLQDDPANTSENSLKTDNVSEDTCCPDDEQCCDNMDDCSNEPSLEEKYAILSDSHLRLRAEFDNFRKRTIREKAELIKSGGATVLTNILPVVDDFERALSTIQATEDINSAVEGVKLIYDKFISYLSQQGVKVVDTIGQPFDTELFEAVATIPAQEEDMKGKVIDCVQTGYMLYDKVLRHAKVVVGE